MSSAVKITLSEGAKAKNIFWLAPCAAKFATTSSFEGNVLGQTGINQQTGGTMNGECWHNCGNTLNEYGDSCPLN